MLGGSGTDVARGLALRGFFSAGAQRELPLVFHRQTNSISSFYKGREGKSCAK